MKNQFLENVTFVSKFDTHLLGNHDLNGHRYTNLTSSQTHINIKMRKDRSENNEVCMKRQG